MVKSFLQGFPWETNTNDFKKAQEAFWLAFPLSSVGKKNYSHAEVRQGSGWVFYISL